MNIDELKNREYDVAVDIMGDMVMVTYYPHAMDAEGAETCTPQDKENPDHVSAFLESFCKIVKWWDVQEDGTEDMVPITPERLRTIPITLLTIVMQATENDKMARQDDAAKRMWQRSNPETAAHMDRMHNAVARLIGEDEDPE